MSRRNPTPLSAPDASPATGAEPAPDAAAPLRVRATRLGFLDHRRRVGDVFLCPAHQFSSVWMERVDADVPLQAQSAQQAARQGHTKLLAGPPRMQLNGADLEEDDEEDAGDADTKPTGDKSVI